MWEQDINRTKARGFTAEGDYVHQSYYEVASTQVQKADQAGIKILVGTDNIDTLAFTGSSVHGEMGSLNETGISPLKILQAATIRAAKFTGVQKDYSSIEARKMSELVILDSNPLENIRHTRSISGVFHGNRYFSKTELDALENDTTKVVGSVQLNLHYLYRLVASPLMRIQLAD